MHVLQSKIASLHQAIEEEKEEAVVGLCIRKQRSKDSPKDLQWLQTDMCKRSCRSALSQVVLPEVWPTVPNEC